MERRAATRGASVNEEIVEVLQRFETAQDLDESRAVKEIAAIPSPSRDALLNLADRRKPPQAWYAEEDELF